MRKYLSDEAKLANDTEDKYMFELKSIVIHRGGAFGGHYYAYIKDDLNEGNWFLEKNIEVEETPIEIKRKKYNPEDHMSEQQLKELEEKNEEKNKNKNNKKKNKDKQKNKEVVELDFSKCEFPIPYSRNELVENWYEFNDSSVNPIYPGTLQSKFGGNSTNGNAYMLVYRQKGLNNDQKIPVIPEHLKNKMKSLNENEEVARKIYDDLKL